MKDFLSVWSNLNGAKKSYHISILLYKIGRAIKRKLRAMFRITHNEKGLKTSLDPF